MIKRLLSVDHMHILVWNRIFFSFCNYNLILGLMFFLGADGKRYRVRYTADEFGYHPVTSLDDEPEIV